MMVTVANKPKTPHRTVRVPDEVWLPAKVKAESEGSNLSEKIREWLIDYATEDAPKTELGPGEIRAYGNMQFRGDQVIVGADVITGLPFTSPPVLASTDE